LYFKTKNVKTFLKNFFRFKIQTRFYLYGFCSGFTVIHGEAAQVWPCGWP